MHGDYLICPDCDPQEPKIYLLVEVEGDTIGICVNREFTLREEARKKQPLLKITNFLEDYKEFECINDQRDGPLPILRGGDSVEGMFVLHNALAGYDVSDRVSKLYQVNLLDDFYALLIPYRLRGYIHFVYGFQQFAPGEIAKNIESGKWQRRKGPQAMTYGTNLQAKARYIDTLRDTALTEVEVGDLGVGNMLSGWWYNFRDLLPAIMHIGVISYLDSINPSATYDENLRVLRMMIVVAEAEGNDVLKTMEKYSSTQFVEKFNAAVDGGLHFKLLEDFDKRQDMLLDLGLDPFHYDFLAFEMFEYFKSKEPVKKELSGRTLNVMRTLDKLAQLTKSKGDVGGKS